MYIVLTTFLGFLSASTHGAVLPAVNSPSAATSHATKRDNTAWMTPHDMYSSSVGVLGCMIDTNRVAYWPEAVDCNNICVEVSHHGRTVNLLRIDQSQGAYDISYDAFNFLTTGKSALEAPTNEGSPTEMSWRYVDADKCKKLIKTAEKKLPLSAANSMNYAASCLEQPSSWIAQNHDFFNILDPICSLGRDEKCSLDWPASHNPTCAHTLGEPVALDEEKAVVNIRFPTGELVLSTTNTVIESAPATSSADEAEASGAVFKEISSNPLVMALIAMLMNVLKGLHSN